MPVKQHKTAKGRCRAKTKSGTRCAAPALRGAGLCSLHSDPRRAAEIGRKGGKRNRKLYNDGPWNLAIPKSPADVKRMLAEAMADVQRARVDPRLGTALAYMGATLLKAFEVSDENAPRIYPNIYRGLTVVKRIAHPEETQEKVVHQGVPAAEQPALPEAESDVAIKFGDDEEVAPGVFRY